jgi:hypothetical protein
MERRGASAYWGFPCQGAAWLRGDGGWRDCSTGRAQRRLQGQHGPPPLRARHGCRRRVVCGLATVPLAHGSVLLEKLMSAEGVRAVIGDHDAAELDAVDAAVIEFADN